MATLDEFRQQNPAYKNTPDDKLADGLYNKFYAGKVDRNTFNQKVGYNPGPGLMEKAAGVVAAPGFAAAQIAAHPIDSAKSVYEGVKNIPSDIGQRIKGDMQGVASGAQGAMDNKNSVGKRVLEGGKAALGFASIPFEAPISALENTYGKLASEGSKMTQYSGKALVSPGSAAVLPSLMLGSGKKPQSDFSGAAQRFGMNFKKAGSPEDIAKEITRASGSYFDKLANMVWHREPTSGNISKPGELASNAIKNFKSRKDEESSLWTAAESAGNALQRDHSEQTKNLTALRKKVADRIASGEDTPDMKKSQALIDRALGELGAPVQPEQQIIEKTKDVGGFTKTVQGERQFPKNAEQSAVKEVDTTTETGNKRFKETSQTPIESAVQVDGKTKTLTQNPYTVTQRIIKGEAPKPPRAGTAADLVRARRAANESSYAAADTGISKEVKNILQDGLADVAKTDKKFAQTHTQALRKTQSNADIYRDDGKAAKFGFDEETLRDVRDKLKSGREISTDTLERMNKGVDNIKTPEDLLFLSRHLDRPEFSMALRAKSSAILADTGTDIKKVVAQRPMLEQIFKMSSMPPAKIKQNLDDLETVAKEMDRYGIPSNPNLDPTLTKMQNRIRAIAKTLSMGMMYTNPVKKMAGSVALDMLPNQNADALALKAFRGSAAAPSRSLSGVGAAGAIGTTVRDSAQ